MSRSAIDFRECSVITTSTLQCRLCCCNPPPPPNHFDIFLSFVGDDEHARVFARSVEGVLRRANLKVFFDKTSLAGQTCTDEVMINAAKSATVGVAIISSNTFLKAWPLLELLLFQERSQSPTDRALLPVAFRMTVDALKDIIPLEPPPVLPEFMAANVAHRQLQQRWQKFRDGLKNTDTIAITNVRDEPNEQKVAVRAIMKCCERAVQSDGRVVGDKAQFMRRVLGAARYVYTSDEAQAFETASPRDIRNVRSLVLRLRWLSWRRTLCY